MSKPVDIRTELAKILANADESTATTTEKVGYIQDHFGKLWDITEGNENAHAIISQAWEDVKVVAEQNAALTFQVIANGNIAHSALEEAQAERKARLDIEDAVERGDEDHPKLRDYAQMIREDAKEEYEEWMADEGWPEAMAEAYEEIRGEMVERIQRLTGCGLGAASRFLSVVMGRRSKFTDYQTEMFAAFIDSFEEIVAAELAAQNGRR